MREKITHTVQSLALLTIEHKNLNLSEELECLVSLQFSKNVWLEEHIAVHMFMFRCVITTVGLTSHTAWGTGQCSGSTTTDNWVALPCQPTSPPLWQLSERRNAYCIKMMPSLNCSYEWGENSISRIVHLGCNLIHIWT